MNVQISKNISGGDLSQLFSRDDVNLTDPSYSIEVSTHDGEDYPCVHWWNAYIESDEEPTDTYWWLLTSGAWIKCSDWEDWLLDDPKNVFINDIPLIARRLGQSHTGPANEWSWDHNSEDRSTTLGSIDDAYAFSLKSDGFNDAIWNRLKEEAGVTRFVIRGVWYDDLLTNAGQLIKDPALIVSLYWD